MTYRPLPTCLTIKESNIDGLGLFATEDIEEGVSIGVSHISNVNFENGYIRTPLGGFVNHSDEPNCVFKKEVTFPPIAKEGLIIRLYTLREISKGEELLTKYWLYSIGENE